MMTPSFATSLAAVKHKTPERQVLSLLNRHGDVVPELRRYLLDDPDVPGPVRDVASSSGRWNKLLAKSIAWRSPDSLPARRLDICRAVVFRVLRTPKNAVDDAVFVRLRMLVALIGAHQLAALPTARPYTHLRNFAVTMNLAPEGKSVKARLDAATDLGMLYRERPSSKGNPGVWVVKGLSKREKLNPAEEAIAMAMFSGDESNFAAALLLHADHLAFHYEPDGLRAWWLLLRVASEPFTPQMSDEEERLVYQVPSLEALDALVSDEAREEHVARLNARVEEKAAYKGRVDAHRKTVDRAWHLIRSNLRWATLTDSNAREWAVQAREALLTVPPEKQHLVREMLAVLKEALPKRLNEPGQSGRVFAYLKEGLNA